MEGIVLPSPKKVHEVAPEGYKHLGILEYDKVKDQGPVVQKPINANLRLKVNQGVYFSTPRCCSTLIFGKTLH